MSGRQTRNHNVLVRGKSLEELVEFYLAMWRKARPQEFAQYIEFLKDQKETLLVQHGMSKNKTMAFKGVIPTELYIVLAHRCPGIWDDPANVRLVHKLVMGDYMPKELKVQYL